VGEHGLAQPERGDEVQVQRLRDRFGRLVLGRAGAGERARHVDENFGPAERLGHAGDERVDLRGVEQVAGHGCAPDLAGERLQAIEPAGGDDHPGAGGGERPGHGRAQPG
jgi:hypothetical protein